MVNPFQDVDWNPSLEARRRFGQSFAIGFPVIAVIFSFSIWWKTGHWAVWPLWMSGGGAAAGALFWFVPQCARPVYLAWHFIGCCVGTVVSNLALIGIFYLVVTPIGLLMRLFGSDPMERRLDRAARTYWREAEKITDPKRYFRQF